MFLLVNCECVDVYFERKAMFACPMRCGRSDADFHKCVFTYSLLLVALYIIYESTDFSSRFNITIFFSSEIV